MRYRGFDVYGLVGRGYSDRACMARGKASVDYHRQSAFTKIIDAQGLFAGKRKMRHAFELAIIVVHLALLVLAEDLKVLYSFPVSRIPT
jgi:hypothetical protein